MLTVLLACMVAATYAAPAILLVVAAGLVLDMANPERSYAWPAPFNHKPSAYDWQLLGWTLAYYKAGGAR